MELYAGFYIFGESIPVGTYTLTRKRGNGGIGYCRRKSKDSGLLFCDICWYHHHKYYQDDTIDKITITGVDGSRLSIEGDLVFDIERVEISV